MKTFRIWLKGRDASYVVQADKVEWSTFAITFDTGAVTTAMFLTPEVQGWKEEPEAK